MLEMSRLKSNCVSLSRKSLFTAFGALVTCFALGQQTVQLSEGGRYYLEYFENVKNRIQDASDIGYLVEYIVNE